MIDSDNMHRVLEDELMIKNDRYLDNDTLPILCANTQILQNIPIYQMEWKSKIHTYM